MDNVRILLANRPRMLRESLRSVLERRPDLEVATAAPDPIEMLAAVDRVEPDVVFVTLSGSGEDPGICSHLLAEYPQLLVIALSPVEQRAVVYRQVITREELRPLAEESLLRVIRRQKQETPRPAGGLGAPEEGSAEHRPSFPRKER